ncbi:RcnB family protein [Jiella sp. M17.18]|uniref:RcnB family protein n=1 Tax=Jiella sp. M17.18 TaxID=3234247 RepID=UPI0034DF7F8C
MLLKPIAVILSLAVAAPAIGAVPALAQTNRPQHHDVTRPPVPQEADRRHEDRGPRHRIARHVRHDRHPAWHRRGGARPDAERGHVVTDWRRHGLHRPGRGQRWVRVGNEYILIAGATGLVASIVAASQ